MKVGMLIGKVKKFGIGWCIPHRMAADNAEGGVGLNILKAQVQVGKIHDIAFRVIIIHHFLDFIRQSHTRKI